MFAEVLAQLILVFCIVLEDILQQLKQKVNTITSFKAGFVGGKVILLPGWNNTILSAFCELVWLLWKYVYVVCLLA